MAPKTRSTQLVRIQVYRRALPKMSQQLTHPGCSLLDVLRIRHMVHLKSGETIHDRAIC
jgi:hypothetical protein